MGGVPRLLERVPMPVEGLQASEATLPGGLQETLSASPSARSGSAPSKPKPHVGPGTDVTARGGSAPAAQFESSSGSGESGPLAGLSTPSGSPPAGASSQPSPPA